MKATHWLRHRQEKSELGYWLSFAAYDQNDRSFLNQAYLIYLFIFLAIWLFVMLVLFAKYGASVLTLISSTNPAAAATTILTVIIAAWNVAAVFASTRRSPVVFSEQDTAHICQTPVDRRKLVLRWMWMPWLKNVILFGLLAFMLGLSLAETRLTGAFTANQLPEYLAYGFRALIAFLPIHLAFFALQWLVGVIRLFKNRQRNWMVFPATGIALSLLFVVILSNISVISTPFLRMLASPVSVFMNAGFALTNNPLILPLGGVFALISLVLLFLSAKGFNLSRASQETRDVEMLTNAARYGFTDLVDQQQLRNRLGSGHKSLSIPGLEKGNGLIWKNYIQAWRSFRWRDLWTGLVLFSITLGLPFLPTFWSRMLAILFWVIQLNPLFVRRLRSDLEAWMITQQLPIVKKELLLNDLLYDLILPFTVSTLAIILGALITHQFAWGLWLCLPGMLVSIGCSAAFDVLRRSKSSLLITGSVPSTGAQCILFGLVGTAIPMASLSFIPGFPGVISAVLGSLLVAFLFFGLAVKTFRDLK